MDVPHITFRSITHVFPSNGGGSSHKPNAKAKADCLICREEAEEKAKKKRTKK